MNLGLSVLSPEWKFSSNHVISFFLKICMMFGLCKVTERDSDFMRVVVSRERIKAAEAKLFVSNGQPCSAKLKFAEICQRFFLIM